MTGDTRDGGDGATMRFTFDSGGLEDRLAALAQLAERSPELAESLVDAFDADEELFTIQCDDAAAARTGHLVVRLEPSDFLRSLLAAAGARYEDLLPVEH